MKYLLTIQSLEDGCRILTAGIPKTVPISHFKLSKTCIDFIVSAFASSILFLRVSKAFVSMKTIFLGLSMFINSIVLLIPSANNSFFKLLTPLDDSNGERFVHTTFLSSSIWLSGHLEPYPRNSRPLARKRESFNSLSNRLLHHSLFPSK